jgi:hypothetical protein
MAQVLVTAEVAGSADELWRLVGRFDRLGEWHPMVVHCEARSGSKGAVRRARLIDGGTLEERLEHVSDEERVCLYSVVSSPLPIANWVAEIRVRDRGGRACVEWSCNFTPLGAREIDAVKAIQDLYQAGLDGLRRLYGARPLSTGA